MVKTNHHITKTMLVMKMTAFLLTAAFLNLSARGVSQNVSFSGKNIPLETVFAEVKKQTGFNISYQATLFSNTQPVSLSVKNVPLRQFLDLLLKDQPLKYLIDSRTILLSRKAPDNVAESESSDPLPDALINGRVTGSDGTPLANINVTIKGNTRGTVTDAEGRFSLNAQQGQTLVFSSVEYESQELKITSHLISQSASGGFSLAVSLSVKQAALAKVVINKGYYSTTQETNTGNVSSVPGTAIEQQPVSNPLAALEGRVAGLFITQSSGLPGGAFAVQIRGQNSIANGNDPFYVIDGVPYIQSPQLAANNNLNPAGGNPLNFINPRDIESIEVLKDADATAIYGSRGANGVVLITTKKGKYGQTKVDFNVYQGIGKITHSVKYVNTQQYLQIRKEAFLNDGADPDPSVDFDVLGGSGWDTTRTIDWEKQLVGGTAHYTDAQVSISGGNELTQYLISGAYHRETTVFPGTASDQKGTMHFNINNTSKNKRFKLTLSGNYGVDQTTLPVVEPLSQISYLAPDDPNPFNPDGSLNWADGTWQYDSNPYSYFIQPYSGRTTNLVSNLLLSYNILPGLDFRTSFGYTNMQMDQKALFPLSSIDPLEGLTSGSSEVNTANTRSWIIEPQLNYKLKTGRGQFSALLGTTFQQNRNEGTFLAGDGFTSDALLGDIQAASTITARSVTDITYKYNAIYGRLSYAYDDKYVLNVTARRDGSSRFGPGKQFADFGAAGAAWVFSKEKWAMDRLSFLSFGKLRASYGTSGNDQVPDYTFFDRYSSTRYPYGGTQGLYPISFYNPDLAWEVNKKLEFGLELGFLKDRLNMTGSFYRNRSSNQLLGYPLSAVTGFSSITENLPAIVQNTGWEFTVNATILKSGDFKWSSSVNLTIPKNKLVAYPGLATSSYRNQFIVGQPITIKRVYKFEGVDPQTGLYQVMGADGKLTSDPIAITDAISVVNTAPKFYGGYQNTLTYGHLSLDFLLQFVKQTGVYFTYNQPGYFSSYEPVTALDRWQKPGDIAPIQRYSQDGSTLTAQNAGALSDQLYKDASYIRLKNLSLSYTLPGSWQQKAGLQNARIYLQGQNLFTITKYKGYDPENQSQFTLPPLTVWTIGLQVTL